MARLPTYQDRSQINTGSQFMRFQRPNDDAARALSGLGRALTGLGSEIVEANGNLSALAEKQAEKDHNIRLESALLDYDRELSENLALQRESMAEGGIGFTNGFETYANDRAGAYIKERFKDREDQEEIELRFERTRQAYLKQAAQAEIGARIEWRDGVAQRKIDSLSGSIAATVANATDENGIRSGYSGAVAEWDRYVSKTFGDNPRVQEIAKQRGMARLQKSFVDAYAATRPKEFVEKFNGVYSGTPNPDNVLSPKAQVVHDAFTTAGVDPKVGGAIWELESRRGKIKRPIGKDGKPMSSAEGDWQILRGLRRDWGITDPYDFNQTTPAIAAHLKTNQDMLARRGFKVTPGTTYMTWNIGPGATMALLRSDPNAEVSGVLTRVWAKQGPQWIAQALRNNPSMYRPGMTVGQVVANYEGKVSRAMGRTQDMWTGADMTVDEKARSVVSGVLGAGSVNLVDASDVHTAYQSAAKLVKENAKTQATITLGNQILAGNVTPEPSNPDHQKAVDEVVENYVNVDGLVQGDLATHSGVVAMAARTRILPSRVAQALNDTIATAGLENPGKTASYVTAARIANDYPEAWANSKVSGDVKARVKEYVANVDALRLNESEAIKRIEDAYTPEGKKARESMKERLKRELRFNASSEFRGRERIWQEIENQYETFFTGIEATDAHKELAVDAFSQAYEHHRLQGVDEETAKGLALVDLKRGWGVTHIDGNARLSPAPIEQTYSGKELNGSFDWIKDQANKIVATHIAEAEAPNGRTLANTDLSRLRSGNFITQLIKGAVVNPLGDALSFDSAETRANAARAHEPPVRVFARRETMDDIRNGKANPRYAIAYRKPDGTVEVIPGVHSFDYETARRDAEARFTDRENARRAGEHEADNTPIIAP